MSYCRWSSDDWKCDIYCYEAEEGYMIHVAAGRIIGEAPKLCFDNPEELLESYQKQMKWLDSAKREVINLEYAGETMSFDTPQETADMLLKLKNIGYNVPEYAIETLLEEVE